MGSSSIICSERLIMSVDQTRKQPKLHFVFKPSTKLKLSQFDPLAVWLEIRDIYQRLNRDRVLGNFPKWVLCFMNSDFVWFSCPIAHPNVVIHIFMFLKHTALGKDNRSILFFDQVEKRYRGNPWGSYWKMVLAILY